MRTLNGDRIHISVFGRRNAGKSSIINAITGQKLAIVSDVKGTTTDPVYKAMEILPIGPCMLVDTPGLDDEGELGKQRIKKALQVLNKTDIAIIVIDITQFDNNYAVPDEELNIITRIKEKKIPYIIALNQADRIDGVQAEQIRNYFMKSNPETPVNIVSSVSKIGLEELKDTIIAILPDTDLSLHLIDDLVGKNDIVVLVTPIDLAAPKGRLIMPQQQVIRDLLDNHAVSIVTQIEELSSILDRFNKDIKLVITDSQAFKEVAAIVPFNIPLTSFSILFARRKGKLKELVRGAEAVNKLKDGDKVLIAEGCTHRKQCDDIGTVKIPRWLNEHSGKKLKIETCSGMDFPVDLSEYSLIIHCGGCTLHEREMKHRIYCAKQQGVPIVNYGIFIAYINGILERSVQPFNL